MRLGGWHDLASAERYMGLLNRLTAPWRRLGLSRHLKVSGEAAAAAGA